MVMERGSSLFVGMVAVTRDRAINPAAWCWHIQLVMYTPGSQELSVSGKIKTQQVFYGITKAGFESWPFSDIFD